MIRLCVNKNGDMMKRIIKIIVDFIIHKNKKNSFELLDLARIKVLSNNAILKMGMSMQDVDKLLIMDADSKTVTKFIFDDTKEEWLDVSGWYNNMSINIIFRNNKLLFMQFPNDSRLMLKKINLANINYKTTLSLLKRKGLEIRETDKDESVIDSLNLILYHPYENELETVSVFVPECYLSEEQKAKYDACRTRENGCDVIRYIPKKENA